MSPLFAKPSYVGSTPVTQAYLNGQPLLKGIVTEGLTMYLDAKDVNSYPGSGSTWYDLTSNNIQATILPGDIAWDSQGWFNFTKAPPSEQYSGSSTSQKNTNFISVPSSDVILGDKYAVEVWCYYNQSSYPSSNPWENGVMWTFSANADWSDAGRNNQMLFGAKEIKVPDNGGSIIDQTYNPQPATQEWHQYVYTGDSTADSAYVYIDGVAVTPKLSAGTFGQSDSQPGIGIGDWSPIGSRQRGLWPGYISIVRIYTNKTLTANEVVQNYNADKARYGK